MTRATAPLARLSSCSCGSISPLSWCCSALGLTPKSKTDKRPAPQWRRDSVEHDARGTMADELRELERDIARTRAELAGTLRSLTARLFGGWGGPMFQRR